MKYLILIIWLLVAVGAEAGLLDLFGLLSWDDKEQKEFVEKSAVSIAKVKSSVQIISRAEKVTYINQAALDRMVDKDEAKRKESEIIKAYNLKVVE